MWSGGELKVEQCKVYLWKNGLRLTGKKEFLIDRIKEHLGIINGSGEQKYPASSFVDEKKDVTGRILDETTCSTSESTPSSLHKTTHSDWTTTPDIEKQDVHDVYVWDAPNLPTKDGVHRALHEHHDVLEDASVVHLGD
ncbi:hypothetical protein C5167_041538 [Papaver somniferum]|nr:hypothetical protein C5167_041538 [Papaver somniferum]